MLMLCTEHKVCQ